MQSDRASGMALEHRSTPHMGVPAQGLPLPPTSESMAPPPAHAPPEVEAHRSWLNRIQKKAARIRKRRTQHIQACRRHRIPKATLVDTLFTALDTRNNGALGRDELTNFAPLTGFQGELDDLFVDITLMLDELGSSVAQSHSKALSLQNFASAVSRSGVLPLSKAELRRTIRYSKAPETQGPLVRSGQSMWRSIKQMNIFIAAARWKEGVCWHRSSSPWVLAPHQCTDPLRPLKTHAHLYRRF